VAFEEGGHRKSTSLRYGAVELPEHRGIYASARKNGGERRMHAGKGSAGKEKVR